MIQKAKSTLSKQSIPEAKLALKAKISWPLFPTHKFVKGKKNAWLASLLKTIRRSQQQMAAMVGVSPNTIANIVSGRSPLNFKLAQKIYVATGANHLTYFGGNDAVFSLSGKVYTKEIFDNWRANYSRTDDKKATEFFDRASDTLFVLLEAARRCRLKNHLPALRQSFFDWCVESEKMFRLAQPIAEVLSQRECTLEMTMTYGDWRNQGSGYQPFYDFKDNPKKPDGEILTLRVKGHPCWSPCGDMKAPASGVETKHLTFRAGATI